MKKLFIIAGACLFFFNAANAQVMGIKGGLNFANISDYGGDSRLSANVGLYFHTKINNTWAIQPEILYSGEGYKYTTITGNQMVLALNYIQVPVMFQVSPVKEFYFEFGPQVGFLTSANIKDNNGNKTDQMGGYNKVNFSLNAGVGIHATRELGFFARYSFGMSDITMNDNRSYYSNVGQLGMTIRLN